MKPVPTINQPIKKSGRMVRMMEMARRKHLGHRLRMHVVGKHVNDGLLFKLMVYIILTSAAVLYLKPLFFMVSTSLKSVPDLLDPTIQWLPTQLEWSNYATAAFGLKYFKSLTYTLSISLVAAVLQMVSCAITGYAFARLIIPGKNFWFLIVLLTFLIPPQTLGISLFVMYSKLEWINTPYPFLIPAIFAQGLKGALFIIIFRQFFATLPKELEESGRMDGAGAFRTFWTIMLPLARPALLIVFLFSFIWHWNDYFEPSLYIRNNSLMPLSLSLEYLQQNLNPLAGSASGLTSGVFNLNEPIRMAAAFLVILPPLIVYSFAQKHFIEGIERTGIVE